MAFARVSSIKQKTKSKNKSWDSYPTMIDLFPSSLFVAHQISKAELKIKNFEFCDNQIPKSPDFKNII
jgi:hypothetical protein